MKQTWRFASGRLIDGAGVFTDVLRAMVDDRLGSVKSFAVKGIDDLLDVEIELRSGAATRVVAHLAEYYGGQRVHPTPASAGTGRLLTEDRAREIVREELDRLRSLPYWEKP